MATIKIGAVELRESALQFKFILSTGPGGQNVNKVRTAVELRFTIEKSGLAEPLRRRIVEHGRSHLNSAGEIVIHATRFRSQRLNREAAVARLAKILESAHRPLKKRIPTRPSARSKQDRLDQKRKTSVKKLARKDFLCENN